MTIDLPDKPYFSIREISALSGVSEPALYLMARDGRIKAIRFGILVRITRDEVARLLKQGTRIVEPYRNRTGEVAVDNTTKA